MRIGLISAEYPPRTGGVGDHTARLAHELRGLGHGVQVVTSYGTNSPDDDNLARGSRVQRIVDRWDWRILFSLPRLAIRQAWDVAHIQYQPGAYALNGAICLLPRFLRRRPTAPAVVTTFHDLAVPYLFPKVGKLRRRFVQDMAQNSDGILSVSDDSVGQLYGWTAGLGHQIAVAHVPLGNHFDEAPPPGFDRDAWRADRGIGPGSIVLGHLGFVNASKAVDATVTAMAMLVAAGHDAHLLMIGQVVSATDPDSGRYLDSLISMIGKLGLSDRVHWTSRVSVPDAVGWLRCVDIMSLPFRDGASLRRTSLIAAWAQGIPVVTTEPSMPVDWLRGTPPVEIAYAPDPQAIAIAIDKLIMSPDLRQELQTRGQEFATRFEWPSVVASTLNLYREARQAPARK